MSQTSRIAARSITLKTVDAKPPTEFRIWAFGDVETTKGTFQLTIGSAAQIMQAAQDWGNKYSLDYNHALPLAEAPTAEQGKAAAWFDLELRDDGLWAANVEWTPSAAEYLKNKEYRYFSPWFLVNETGEIVEFLNAALTNIPATKNMDVLASREDQKLKQKPTRDNRTGIFTSMSFQVIENEVRNQLRAQFQGANDYLWIVELWNDHAIFELDSTSGAKSVFWSVNYTISNNTVVLTSDAVQVERQYTPIPGGKTMKTVIAALKLADTATEAETLERVNGIMLSNSQLLAATGETEVQKALGVIAGWKVGHENAKTLSAKLEELETARKTERLTSLIAKGKADGKLTPAMDAWAQTQSPEALEAFLSVAPRAIQGGEVHEPAPGVAGDVGVLLTWKGKAWKDMKPIEKAELFTADHELYTSMKTQHGSN